MNAIFERHGILVIHLAIVALLFPGLIQRTGPAYLLYMALYVAVLLISYALLWKKVPVFGLNGPGTGLPHRKFIFWVLVLQLVLMVAHWLSLGSIPIVEALFTHDDLVIVDIRRSADEDVPALLAYASHLMIKAVVPFALLLAWSHDRKLFWILAVVAGLYAMSLLAKSLVITLFVPLWIAFLLGRHWRRSVVLCGVFLALTVILSTVANPQKLDKADLGRTGTQVAVDEGVREHGLLGDAALGIANRVFLMPGWTVAEWFTHIPGDLPYAEGTAIRPLAAVVGKPFVDYTEKVYDLAYPDMAEKNVPGTMGSASFMYGYANYGAWGLAISGLITAIVLMLVQSVFGTRWRWATVLNFFPLLALSASALPTVMLTHGWALTILLFLLMHPTDQPGE